jgi:hypothetical protein
MPSSRTFDRCRRHLHPNSDADPVGNAIRLISRTKWHGFFHQVPIRSGCSLTNNSGVDTYLGRDTVVKGVGRI